MKAMFKRWLGMTDTPEPAMQSAAPNNEPRGCYVYAHESLDGEVFYIGKGTRNRVFHHEQLMGSDSNGAKKARIAAAVGQVTKTIDRPVLYDDPGDDESPSNPAPRDPH